MSISNIQGYMEQASLLTNKNVVTLPIEKEIETTPEEFLEIKDNVQEVSATAQEDAQAQKDAQRENFVGLVGLNSRQTQAEIYLSVALDESVSLGTDNSEMMKSLQKVQDQNNAIKAYAAYAQAPEAELRFSA